MVIADSSNTKTQLMAAANILSTLLASILITGPMFVLSIVDNVHRRLGIVMLLTSLFSVMFVNQVFFSAPIQADGL